MAWLGEGRGSRRAGVEEVMGIGSREASLGCRVGTRVARSLVSRACVGGVSASIYKLGMGKRNRVRGGG